MKKDNNAILSFASDFYGKKTKEIKINSLEDLKYLQDKYNSSLVVSCSSKDIWYITVYDDYLE